MHFLRESFCTNFCTRRTFPSLNRLCRAQLSESKSAPSQDPSEESILPPENEESEISEEELLRKRDISRLNPIFRAIVHDKPLPFKPTPRSRFHDSLTVQRHLYGKYGSSIGVDPAVCFITKEEMEDFQEYEKVANNEHILEVRKRKLKELEEEKKQYKIREEYYEKMMATVEQHKQRIREKILNKLSAAEEAKKKREALLEEVKRHFGYTIDPKDEKFQLMLEQKEREQKKLNKEMKKKKREEYFMAKLASLESGQESASDEKTKSSKKGAASVAKNDDDSGDEDEK